MVGGGGGGESGGGNGKFAFQLPQSVFSLVSRGCFSATNAVRAVVVLSFLKAVKCAFNIFSLLGFKGMHFPGRADCFDFF